MTYNLDGKVAIITGGSRGLGLAVAQRLTYDGANVIICGRDIDALTQARLYLEDSRSLPTQKLWSLGVDVANYEEVKALIEFTYRQCKTIDILICCAGIYGSIGQLEKTSWDDWLKTIHINLCGTVACCREVLPIMRQQNHGKIITLSGGGHRPSANFSAYNASKAGIVRFTETMAMELDGTDIDINAVAPGLLDTRLTTQSSLPPPVDGVRAMNKAVDLIEFLASYKSDGLTGRLFSAVHDDWNNLPEYLPQDIYTLRRVTM